MGFGGMAFWLNSRTVEEFNSFAVLAYFLLFVVGLLSWIIGNSGKRGFPR